VKPLDRDLALAVSDEDYVLTRKPVPAPQGFELVTRAECGRSMHPPPGVERRRSAERLRR